MFCTMDSPGASGRRRVTPKLNAEDQALDQIAKEVTIPLNSISFHSYLAYYAPKYATHATILAHSQYGQRKLLPEVRNVRCSAMHKREKDRDMRRRRLRRLPLESVNRISRAVKNLSRRTVGRSTPTEPDKHTLCLILARCLMISSSTTHDNIVDRRRKKTNTLYCRWVLKGEPRRGVLVGLSFNYTDTE